MPASDGPTPSDELEFRHILARMREYNDLEKAGVKKKKTPVSAYEARWGLAPKESDTLTLPMSPIMKDDGARTSCCRPRGRAVRGGGEERLRGTGLAMC